MFTRPAILATLALTLVAAPVSAQRDWSWLSTQDNADGTVRSSGAMPGDGYRGRYWTHPMGCEYSRAGRPGETVWYLLLPTRKRGCPTYIVQRGGADAYRRP